MKILEKLQKKKSRLVVGLMSGTSVDGIDAALVRITGSGTSTHIRLLAFQTYSYPAGFREFVLQNSQPGSGSVDVVCGLNVLFGHFFADAARHIARAGGHRIDEIDLVGSHGQTVHHLPRAKKMFGKSVRSSLQIGDPSTIARLTGVPTVGDFRMADMAAGGQGAPLAPYLDYILFRSPGRNRLLLNLGGIANVTGLPKHSSLESIIAFDTGPANMVIDALTMKLFRRPFDKDGRIAGKGKIIPQLLRWMMSHEYFDRRPPKSTGREVFGEAFVDAVMRRAKGVPREDIVATATEMTASSVFDQYRRFVKPSMSASELIVSGGGAHNGAILRSLRKHFAPIPVKRMEDLGFSSDAKEAVLFALLANETVSERPSNVPRATGARRPVILGKICLL